MNKKARPPSQGSEPKNSVSVLAENVVDMLKL